MPTSKVNNLSAYEQRGSYLRKSLRWARIGTSKINAALGILKKNSVFIGRAAYLPIPFTDETYSEILYFR